MVGRVGALLICASLYVVGLQCGRMMVHPDEVWREPGMVGPRDLLGFLGSPLLLMAGFSLFSFGLVLLPHRRRGRIWAMFGLQAAALLILLVETGAQVHFYTTGQTLDWPLFAAAARDPARVAIIGLASVPSEVWLSLAASALFVATVPLWSAARGRFQWAEAPTPARARPAALPLCAAGAIVAVCGFLPHTALAIDAASPRDPILNLVASALSPRRLTAPLNAPVRERAHASIELTSQGEHPLRNVVVVMLASTRALATSVYNPQLQTTPYLAELAMKSLVIDRMQAGVPATQKAIQDILCGFEASHSAKLRESPLGALIDCMPNLLRTQGYRTVFMQSADETLDFRASSVFSMGFDEFIGPANFGVDGFERPNQVGWDDESMLVPTRALLKRYRRQPLFVAYLTVDAHSECQPMARRGHVHFSDRPDYDCYLNALRADDFFVHELIRQYEDLGLLHSTLFIIVGDHGEAFGEHGRRMHQDDPWQEVLHIPALIYDPNGESPAPGHLGGTASQIDLAPTVAALLGYQVNAGAFPGQSLLQLPRGERIVHSACNGDHTCLASVQADLKFIDHQDRRADELFDLRADPLEQKNLSSEQPGVTATRKAEVRAWDEEIKAGYQRFLLHRAEQQESR